MTTKTVMYEGKRIPIESVLGGPSPKVGEDVYLPTRWYLSHGRDDFQGGLCKVTKVYVDTSAGDPTWFIEVAERPGYSSNWASLREDQAKLKAEFGDKRGYPDPDEHPDSNDW